MSRPNGATITITVANHQRRDPVPLAWLARVARCAARHLRIGQGQSFSIAFIDGPTMRALNQRWTRQTGLTDVLSFRYDDAPVTGEILIAPAAARRYAREHGLGYRQELARYVIHGLLHWVGHEDRTPTEQQRMRRLEERALAHCLGRDGHSHR